MSYIPPYQITDNVLVTIVYYKLRANRFLTKSVSSFYIGYYKR